MKENVQNIVVVNCKGAYYRWPIYYNADIDVTVSQKGVGCPYLSDSGICEADGKIPDTVLDPLIEGKVVSQKSFRRRKCIQIVHCDSIDEA